MSKPLAPYQREAAEKFEKARRYLFAMDPGMGKTRAALYAARSFNRVLVLAPKNALSAWQDETEILYLTNHHAPKVARLTFVTYGSAKSPDQKLFHWIREQPWDLVIADEADIMKNPETDVSRAYALDPQSVLQRCDSVLLLTGTPIRGRVREFYPLLCILRRGGMNYQQFLDTFCKEESGATATSGATTTAPVAKGPVTRSRAAGLGFSNRAAFSDMLSQISYHATKADLPAEFQLPPLKRVHRLFNLPPNTDLTAYNRAQERYFNALAMLGHSKNTPDEARWSRAVRDARCDQLKEANYVRNQRVFHQAVKAAVEESKNTNAIFFVEHQETAKALLEYLGETKVFHLDGQSDAEERARVIRFMADERNTGYVGVFSLRACGVAATLCPGCTRVYFVSISFSPGDHFQAENRVHRLSMNRNKPATVEYWTVKGLLCTEVLQKTQGDKIEQQLAMRNVHKTIKQIYEERFTVVETQLQPVEPEPEPAKETGETGETGETVGEMLAKLREARGKRVRVG